MTDETTAKTPGSDETGSEDYEYIKQLRDEIERLKAELEFAHIEMRKMIRTMTPSKKFGWAAPEPSTPDDELIGDLWARIDGWNAVLTKIRLMGQ